MAELERLARSPKRPIEEQLWAPLRDYWLARAAFHTHDSYAGIQMSKFPEDLRVYEHLLWAQRPNVVVEIGTQFGASALWFRDRLRTLHSYGLIAEPHVITLDTDTSTARALLTDADPNWERDISLVTADVCDPEAAPYVASLVPTGANCFVIEDSAHTYATTLAALEGFSGLVRPDGFMMIEDGCVDIDSMRLREDWPRGVLAALDDWLAGPAGAQFRQRRDLELYGLTCHPRGLLQRR